MKKTTVQSLYHDSASPPEGERFEVLARRGGVEVERIISADGPHETRYVQTHDEWVMLARGWARLEVAGEVHALRAGDCVWLPAQTPHQVLETGDDALWLAVHLRGDEGAE